MFNYLFADSNISFEIPSWLNAIWNWITTEGIKVILVLLVLFISFKITNLICKKIDKKLQIKNFDTTLRTVLIPVVRVTIKVLLVVCGISYLGFETSSISAAILSIGATIGLALQGSLSNFAGGILIVVLKPYKMGDYIETNEQSGTVSNISLFYTQLTTPDNKVVVIPNSTITNNPIVNYSKMKTRREDMIFSITYNQDFNKAKDVILQIIKDCDYILKTPAPFVNIKEHAEDSIKIIARYWTNSEDYWKAHWYLLEAVKTAFDKEGIIIPYKQIDVHLDKIEK